MTAGGAKLLVVEDDRQLRRFLRVSLSSHGHSVAEAETAKEALKVLTSERPKLVLLDLSLPDVDGIELTRQIRAFSAVPIIVISARRREDDKVVVLDAGADDYVEKPFGLAELLARIRVALRRHPDEPSEGVAVFGPMSIDHVRRVVRVHEREVRLTPTEYRLLTFLAKHAGRVVTHQQILDEVWGKGSPQQHYVRVYMAEIRKKIEDDPARPKLVLTEQGVGYRLRERDEPR